MTAEFGYVENGADAQIIFDPDSIFQNSDTVCPIISCSYHSAGDCGGVVLEDLIDVVSNKSCQSAINGRLSTYLIF